MTLCSRSDTVFTEWHHVTGWHWVHVIEPTVCGDGFEQQEEGEWDDKIADPVNTRSQRGSCSSRPQRVNLRVDSPRVRAKTWNRKGKALCVLSSSCFTYLAIFVIFGFLIAGKGVCKQDKGYALFSVQLQDEGRTCVKWKINRQRTTGRTWSKGYDE